MSEETEINETLAKKWSWVPASVRAKFTPTSVISIIVTAFTFGGAVAVYKFKYQQAEHDRREDHEVLVKLVKSQTDTSHQIDMHLQHLDDTLQGVDQRLGDVEAWRNGKGVPTFSTTKPSKPTKHK